MTTDEIKSAQQTAWLCVEATGRLIHEGMHPGEYDLAMKTLLGQINYHSTKIKRMVAEKAHGTGG